MKRVWLRKWDYTKYPFDKLISDYKNATKAFSCISRVETADGYISVIFNKKPDLNFAISMVGG